ncbi:MAG: hypothetical protein JNN07_21300 [Verrucomicrobiales bacterium]|nr:hypothetical protein [Verrucomicrobiales bacterium]
MSQRRRARVDAWWRYEPVVLCIRAINNPDWSMKKLVPSVLLSHGLLSILLGFLALQTVPDLSRLSGIVGLLGGGFSVLWALLGFWGKPQRGWAMLTLSATAFVMISQAVMNWLPAGDPVAGTRNLAILATVMVVITVGTLMAVAHIGVTLMLDSSTSSADLRSRASTRDATGASESEEWKSARRRASLPNGEEARRR